MSEVTYDAHGLVFRSKDDLQIQKQRIPVFWQPSDNSPENIIGYADLEKSDEGTLCYIKFNEGYLASLIRQLVEKNDITYLKLSSNNQSLTPSLIKGTGDL